MIRNPKGLTLIEVMIAVLLFALMIGALLSVCIQSAGAGRRGDLAYQAYNLAKNRVETVKALSFADISSAAESATVINEEGIPTAGGLFSRDTTVTTSYSGDANLVQVTVTVSYTHRGVTTPQPMKMTTVIFNGG